MFSLKAADMSRLRFLLFAMVLNQCGVEIYSAQDLQDYADGSRDATQVLQSLVDQRRGLVDLPAGEFRIQKTIDIDLTAQGYCALRGSSATKIVMAGAGPAFRFRGSHYQSADPGGFKANVWDSERMPTLIDLAIAGEHPQADGIQALGTMQLTISRVHFRKLRHAIHLAENNRNVIIDACHIYENSGIGVFYDQVNLHQSNIVGCHISYCAGGGVVSRGGNVRNIHISGCDIESNMGADRPPTANVFIDCRDSDYGTAEVAISGCTIQHRSDAPDSANIRVIGRSNPQGPLQIAEGHVTITGNVLSDVQHNIWLDGCRGVTLTGNTFWMGSQHNLLVENSSHIVMAGNNFDRNPRYNYGTAASTLNRLVFRNCRDSSLAGLHIAHVAAGQAALELLDCSRLHVSGLTILDCDIGLKLENVTHSRFSDCMIRDDRQQAGSVPLLDEGGEANVFDASFSK